MKKAFDLDSHSWYMHQQVVAVTIRDAQAPGLDVSGFGTALMPFS